VILILLSPAEFQHVDFWTVFVLSLFLGKKFLQNILKSFFFGLTNIFVLFLYLIAHQLIIWNYRHYIIDSIIFHFQYFSLQPVQNLFMQNFIFQSLYPKMLVTTTTNLFTVTTLILCVTEIFLSASANNADNFVKVDCHPEWGATEEKCRARKWDDDIIFRVFIQKNRQCTN